MDLMKPSSQHLGRLTIDKGLFTELTLVYGYLCIKLHQVQKYNIFSFCSNSCM